MAERMLRAVFFSAVDNPVMTVVMESDLEKSIEDAIEEIEDMACQGGGLVLTDVLEADDDGLAASVIRATNIEPDKAERERNMAILYHWDVMSLQHVAANGLLMQTVASPLTREEIVTVLKQVCLNPVYEGQTLHAIDEDGKSVRVVQGEVLSDVP